MANVCVIRHKGYIKSKVHFPYQHNMRTLKDYSNKNIEQSNTCFNSIIENNLQEGETFLKAFNRLRDNGAFTGQLKIQGSPEKQTKYLDEFLIYPPFEKINEMTLYEQDQLFQKELKALHEYFPDMIVLTAVVHRDEVFHPLDADMKALFPAGKITPHMHITAIPVIHDKKNNCKKISISALWKGKNSYRKFQDYMHSSVGKEYGFDRGEIHDFEETRKHLEVESFKLQEASKSLSKLESDISKKEQELSERAKVFEPEEHITILNVKKIVEQQKVIHHALKQEKEKNALLQEENEVLISSLTAKDDIILNQTIEIQNQLKKVSETEKQLSDEKERTNEILNLKVSHEGVRVDAIERAKIKFRLFDLLLKTVMNHLPELFKRCPKFILDLVNIGILSDEDLPNAQSKEELQKKE